MRSPIYSSPIKSDPSLETPKQGKERKSNPPKHKKQNVLAVAEFRVDTFPLALVGVALEVSAAISLTRLVETSVRPLPTQTNEDGDSRGDRIITLWQNNTETK